MRDFEGRIGVLTGAGTGIGRALAQQLVAKGCHLAICDISDKNLEETTSLCKRNNPAGAEVTGFVCDVADEGQLRVFCDDVRRRHDTNYINLLINNAGVSGGGSFVNSTREEWDRTFEICWYGVYYTTRVFLPMLLNADSGHIVNVSSANALRGVLGGHVPHTAYSTAKFAVRGFTESLIHDFRFNAPHLKASVVIPGHVGTELMANSANILEQNQPTDWTREEVDRARARWRIAGTLSTDMDDKEVRNRGRQEIEEFKKLGLMPSEAAQIILDGVRNDEWRILIGDDTIALDDLVRESPDTAYDPGFVERWREAYDKRTARLNAD